ncbi:hypothetical protein ALC62_00251, partial [Cyphomyrmex costatus]
WLEFTALPLFRLLQPSLAVLRGVADQRRETDDSLIHRPPVTSAYLITTSNCE